MFPNKFIVQNMLILTKMCLFSDVPSEPRNCHVKKVNKDNMLVAWERPANDGGSPVVGYCIERKERNSLLWVKANETVVRGTEYSCSGLIDGLEYTFRVSALNLAGQGKPSKQTDFITARTPVGMLCLHYSFFTLVSSYAVSGKCNVFPPLLF